MKFLLDTHLLLWLAGDLPALSSRARQLLADPAHTFFFSTISIWEVVIKYALRQRGFEAEPSLLRLQLLENGFQELTLTTRHVLEVGNLPNIHKDPFDRALIAQARVERLTLLTADATVAKYPGAIWKV